MARKDDLPHSHGPAGGWGSLEGIAEVFGEAKPSPAALRSLGRLNKPKGVMCMSCAWPKPSNYSAFEFCENGAKATLWELTSARCGPDFWQNDAHSIAALRSWSDHALESTGRLTHPLRYNESTDRYEEIGWDEAFAEIGSALRAVEPARSVFYAAGHAGLEASFLYGIFARAFGTNNLPQSSNMCHETTSVGLAKVIGSPVGTVSWEDLQKADAYFFFGQNPGTNSPRFLHPLKEAKDRGASIVTFNPIVEQGLVSFVDPQNLRAMLTGHETKISDQYHQLKAGSDIAAITGMCKHIIGADDAARSKGIAGVIDHTFISEHCTGFSEFADFCRATSWAVIEAECGLSRADLASAGEVYCNADRVIGVYGMGLTQHSHGALNVAMVVNLLLLRGNIGREGAGCCPVRGHSNVQGQRTVGIAEKAHLVPRDRIAKNFGFDPPKNDGMNIVEVVEALFEGGIDASICLGGNLLRAVPDQKRMEASWGTQKLTVSIATKLNRSHLFPGRKAFILPCLGRSEEDLQASGRQTVTTEDSFSMISASVGHVKPASDHLKSEMAIVAGLAQATLEQTASLQWSEWVSDYGKVRDLIEAVYPKDFERFNRRLYTPGGFFRGNAARERVWKTVSGKAEFTTPDRLNALGFEPDHDVFRLITLRSNDQFNTTIYGYSDRFRGIEGTRDVVLMNPDDIERLDLHDGCKVAMVSAHADGIERRLEDLKLKAFSIPIGTVASYYPECNVLAPIELYDQLSKTPASKGLPVYVLKQ